VWHPSAEGIAWNGLPGNSITATGFTAAWSHRGVTGVDDCAQVSNNDATAITMIATDECLVRLQIIAVGAVVRIRRKRPNARFQPRRLILSPAAAGCKSLLARRSDCVESIVVEMIEKAIDFPRLAPAVCR
jgi:hypothetical protein